MQQVWTRLGFVYEADIHCESCALEQFGPEILHDDTGAIEDREGNLVTPYTVGDASGYASAQYDRGENPNVYCGNCRALLYEADYGLEARLFGPGSRDAGRGPGPSGAPDGAAGPP